MSQALYLRWRPQTWDEVVGQEHVVRTLQNSVRAGRTVHAYLFAGPRGTGKTTTARLLAKALNCLADDSGRKPCNECVNCVAVNEGRFLDLIEIDAASNTSVEDVRELRDKINFRPNQGICKVYIIDEVHMLSTAAFNALLKTLEEPPPHAVFILATTEVHKIPATVLSRCQRHEFRRVPTTEIAAFLEARCAAEGVQVEPAALLLIARTATGSLRDAISLLDQLASTGETVTPERTRDVIGTAGGEAVAAIVAAMGSGEAGAGMAAIQASLDGGADARQLARQVVDYLRGVMLIQMGQADLIDAPRETYTEMETRAAAIPLEGVLAGMRSFGRAATEARLGWQPGLGLELALLDTMQVVGRGGPKSPGSAPTSRRSQPAAAATDASPEPAKPRGTTERPPTKVAPRPAAESATSAKVSEQWDAILAAAYRLDTRTQALLKSGRFLGVHNGRVVLGFPTEILREKMEKGHSLGFASRAIEEVIGVALPVRCVLQQHWSNEGESDREAAPPMEDDGMVATAVRELGGHVVAVRPAPSEPSA
ncbi:MAG TPA: DNA polymerase III subunit gamma/tau [Anaerolineales bacterium]|nr:DNA polymerase III subunit gamma/tau [Anaerolineales bacterium]